MDHLPDLLRAATGTTPLPPVNAAMLILGSSRMKQGQVPFLWCIVAEPSSRTAVAVLEGLARSRPLRSPATEKRKLPPRRKPMLRCFAGPIPIVRYDIRFANPIAHLAQHFSRIFKNSGNGQANPVAPTFSKILKNSGNRQSPCQNSYSANLATNAIRIWSGTGTKRCQWRNRLFSTTDSYGSRMRFFIFQWAGSIFTWLS